MTKFAPALPHGPLVEVFPNVFEVQGGFRVAPGVTFTRNMTVLRTGGELALVNSVRLSPEGLAALDALGKVTQLFKIGAFHGIDDPFYVDRYQPTFWAPPGSKHQRGIAHQRDLLADAAPLPETTVFAFAAGKEPEVALLVAREGGMLVTCDSYQNWTTFDGCSWLGKIVMRIMGFGPCFIGGPWAMAMGRGVIADFARLAEQPFRHLLPAHGTVLRDDALAGLRQGVRKRYGA